MDEEDEDVDEDCDDHFNHQPNSINNSIYYNDSHPFLTIDIIQYS